MYIGRLGNGDDQADGIYVLLKEIIDNSIDEFSMGYGNRVNITITEDGEVTIRDYGRGIPLTKVVDATSKLNTGGKFDDRNFKKSLLRLRGPLLPRGTVLVRPLLPRRAPGAVHHPFHREGRHPHPLQARLPDVRRLPFPDGLRRDDGQELLLSQEGPDAGAQRHALQERERPAGPRQREHVRDAALSADPHRGRGHRDRPDPRQRLR